MKLTLGEPKYLKDSISIISDLVTEARFKITKDSLEMIAMDPANIAMVIFKLLSNVFIEYDVDSDKDITINLSYFKQILKRAKSSDVLVLELEDDSLKITLKGLTTRSFKIPLLEPDTTEQKIPNLDFKVAVHTNSILLAEAISDVEIVSDVVDFIVRNKKFIIEGRGTINEVKIDTSNDPDTKVNVSTNEEIISSYSIEYLKKMIAGSRLAEFVNIHFSQDWPLKLEYIITDKLSLTFILAPRERD